MLQKDIKSYLNGISMPCTESGGCSNDSKYLYRTGLLPELYCFNKELPYEEVLLFSLFHR